MNGILYQINHDSQSVIFDEIHSGTSESLDELGMEIESNVTDDVVDSLLSAPVSSTELASEKISFTRLKSGVWGFQSDKTETVNSYEAKVYSVNKVELITRQRTEHLPIELREQVKQKGGTFASIMKFATSQAEGNDGSDDEGDAESGRATSLTPVPPVLSPRISAEEYFLGTPSEHTTGYSNNSESLEEDDSSDTEDVPHVSDNTKDKYSRLVHEGKGSAESEESSASSLLSFSSWKSGAKKLLNGVSNVTSSAFSSSSSSSANNYSSNLGNSSNETDSNNSSGAFKTISSAPESVSSSDAKSPAYAIGRPLVMTEQVQKFKATAWMSDDFPLSLQQQVIPIINLMVREGWPWAFFFSIIL